MKRRSTTTPEAIFLVDGYNIVGAWRELKKARDKLGLEEARRKLVEMLMGFASYHGYNLQIVFDAQYQDTPGSREVITKFVSVYYTNAGQTADTYIEKTCADFRQDLRKFDHRLIVATNDTAQKLTVIGYGAEWLSAERLANEVELAAMSTRSKQKLVPKKPSGRLMNSLDPESQAKLDRLRYGK
ncbi:NYN domain-containing protein [filamentous cyanobacterium LEGE 11480]|uniref:NYN domain-containing protein n=1 Tax=Romeriopsis navalis LEGE 11480 TaxID=2777977 RepID=A0A928VPF9_9CYAN|nr:NYN domain-containing protein [Romeriopsis navalis]MBE9029714.1 NYN domain-containing protein [Romeriopsis navalis LEGE 11480]